MKIHTFIFLVSLILVSACENNQNNGELFLPTSITVENECIGTFEDFAYIIPKLRGESRDVVLPLYPWEIELTLDAEIYSSVEISRKYEGQTEIWIRRKSNLGLTIKDQLREFLIYFPINQGQFIISAEIDNTNIWVDKLFLANDGSVWGRNIWDPWDDYNADSMPLLSKYNEQTKQFEFDNSAIEIPVELNNSYVERPQILVGENNLYWVFFEFDGLFSYDSSTSQIERHISIPDYRIASPLLGFDGNIYYIKEHGLSETYRNNIIFMYDPEENIVSKLDSPDELWPHAFSMIFDHADNLWLSSVGWRGSDGEWHLLYPEPIEYFKSRGRPDSFLWANAEIILESSNNYIWFSKNRDVDKGLAWYDPTTGNSCWFTNIDTNIIEDSHGIMWVVADRSLYKFDLDQ